MGRILFTPRRVTAPVIYPVKYGLLYNWLAATDARGITSAGDFVVPERSDWEILANYTGEYSIEDGWWLNGGNKLKETGSLHWDGNESSNNETGFTALGTGKRYDFGDFGEIRISTAWWSRNSDEYGYIEGILLQGMHSSIFKYLETKNSGLSLRLVRPATESEQLLADGAACEHYVGNDGKIYRTVKIGTQVWTADNLCETKYRNGNWIHGFDNGDYTPISNTDWAALTTAGCCAYNNDITLI